MPTNLGHRAALWIAAALAAVPGHAQLAAPAPFSVVAAFDAKAAADLATKIVTDRKADRYPEARELARRAFGAGQAEAGNLLSLMLQLGLGGPADPGQAKKVREAAAKAGSIGASLTIADAHLKGSAPYRQDPKAAFRYLEAAARSDQAAGNGRAIAQWRLAMMLREGIGTRKDLRQAYAWVVRASDGGDRDAMISRAVMLATGEGVDKDAAQARLWYAKAAALPGNGYAHPLRGLGGMLAFGEGGPVDLPRAFAYLSIAKAAGDPRAGQLIELIAPRLTPEMREEAAQIARRWPIDRRKAQSAAPSTP